MAKARENLGYEWKKGNKTSLPTHPWPFAATILLPENFFLQHNPLKAFNRVSSVKKDFTTFILIILLHNIKALFKHMTQGNKKQQHTSQHPNTPSMDSLVAHKNLRAAVLHCASKLWELLARSSESWGSKVDEFDMESVVHDYIFILHITVDDVEGVQVGEGSHNLKGRQKKL